MAKKRALIARILRKEKRPSPKKQHPEQYARMVWLDKDMSRGVETIAEMERKTIKATVRMLLEDAFSRYMGELLREKNDTRLAIREGKIQKHQVKNIRIARLKKRLLKEGERPKVVDYL